MSDHGLDQRTHAALEEVKLIFDMHLEDIGGFVYMDPVLWAFPQRGDLREAPCDRHLDLVNLLTYWTRVLIIGDLLQPAFEGG